MTDKAQRGLAAQHLLENELLKEVMNDLDGTYHDKWRSATTVEAREDLHRYVKILEQIRDDIRTIAITGKLEERRLNTLAGVETPPSLNGWAKAERGNHGRL